jgi:hypothetical protein
MFQELHSYSQPVEKKSRLSRKLRLCVEYVLFLLLSTTWFGRKRESKFYQQLIEAAILLVYAGIMLFILSNLIVSYLHQETQTVQTNMAVITTCQAELSGEENVIATRGINRKCTSIKQQQLTYHMNAAVV